MEVEGRTSSPPNPRPRRPLVCVRWLLPPRQFVRAPSDGLRPSSRFSRWLSAARSHLTTRCCRRRHTSIDNQLRYLVSKVKRACIFQVKWFLLLFWLTLIL